MKHAPSMAFTDAHTTIDDRPEPLPERMNFRYKLPHWAPRPLRGGETPCRGRAAAPHSGVRPAHLQAAVCRAATGKDQRRARHPLAGHIQRPFPSWNSRRCRCGARERRLLGGFSAAMALLWPPAPVPLQVGAVSRTEPDSSYCAWRDDLILWHQERRSLPSGRPTS